MILNFWSFFLQFLSAGIRDRHVPPHLVTQYSGWGLGFVSARWALWQLSYISSSLKKVCVYVYAHAHTRTPWPTMCGCQRTLCVGSAPSYLYMGSGDWTQDHPVCMASAFTYGRSYHSQLFVGFSKFMFSHTSGKTHKNYLIQWLVKICVFPLSLWFSCHGSYMVD